MSKRAFVLVCTFVLVASSVFSACSLNRIVASVMFSDISEDISAENNSFSENIGSVESNASEGVSESISINDSSSSESSEEPFDETSVNISDSDESDITPTLNESSAYERDRKIYTDHLLSTKYNNLYVYDIYPDVIEISSRMFDLDNDGTYELLLYLTSPEDVGPASAYKITLFTIKNGRPIIMHDAEHYGGTMGGEYLSLVHDVNNECLALEVSASYRDGYMLQYNESIYYTIDTKFISPAISLSIITYSKEDTYYDDEIAALKKETNIYDEDECNVTAYQINEQYVTREQFSITAECFVEADKNETAYFDASYNNPILSWNEVNNLK